jgi:hypothetical protein
MRSKGSKHPYNYRVQRIIILPNARYGVAKVSKQIRQLFLRLLNFSRKLLALIRAAVGKLQRDRVAREPNEAELREYAHLVLRAHFAEDRNEFLDEGATRAVGAETLPAIGNSKPQ